MKPLALGWTMLEYSVYTTIGEWITDEQLLLTLTKELIQGLKPYLLPDWQEQAALSKKVEEELRTFLRKNLKAQLNISLDDLDAAYNSILETLLTYETWN
jgi:ABC-type uncharacterized transport system permease subunit